MSRSLSAISVQEILKGFLSDSKDHMGLPYQALCKRDAKHAAAPFFNHKI